MIHIFKYLDTKTKYLTIIGALANGGLALGQPLVVSKALSIDQNSLTYSSIWKFALFGFSVYFALYSLMLFCNHANNVFQREIQMNIRTKLLQKLIEDREYSEDEKITMLTQDMEFLGDNFFRCYMSISCWGFGALITAIYIIAQNVILGSIFVFFTILRPIPQFLMNNRLKNSGEEMSQERTAVHNQISDSIQGAQTLRMNQALSENYQRVWNINLRYQRAIQRFAFTHNFVFFCNGFMVFLSQVLPLVLGFFLAMHNHHVYLANLVAMYIAAGQLVGPIQNIMYDVADMQGAKTTVDKIFGILNRIDDREVDSHSISQVAYLEIFHLNKSYNGREIIHDLNLTIQQGEKVLIKGPSGCGKSTLFRMIIGKEKADSGMITCITEDGAKISNFIRQVGIISQHPFLFNDTVRYNLSLGQKFSDQELDAVLKQVKLDYELTNGLDFVITDNGENISGGQRVRIELARFLLRKKEILLVDEVTAALDVENSQMVRDLIFSLPMMVLEIAHHINNESRYNQVIELRKDCFSNESKMLYSMKIKEQTRKLVAGCSKHCFEVADRTDEVSTHTNGKATHT